MSFLSQFTEISTDLMGPFGPLLILGMSGFFLLLLALLLFQRMSSDPIEKLGRADQRKAQSAQTERLRRAGNNAALAKYSALLEPQDEAKLSKAREKLIQAGYHSRDALRLFNLAQVALCVIGLIGGVGYYMLFMAGDPSITTQKLLMYNLGPGVAGYMMPGYCVAKKGEKRQKQIEGGFPDALDMMLVCVEAGQSLDQAIVRVAGELRASYPDLSDEFEVVAYEMKAGKDKAKVLNDMAYRCAVQDISSFVTVLVQSQTFGTSIADALRVYAGEMRDKRVMRAEEKANKLPTQMTLATMMLTVPPLLIILVGPSVVGIQNLGN